MLTIRVPIAPFFTRKESALRRSIASRQQARLVPVKIWPDVRLAVPKLQAKRRSARLAAPKACGTDLIYFLCSEPVE